ncbi:hypothetical protein ACJJI3_02375 [Microbulbifer sp. ZKSA004]|uniref:hypothetical protein n=1 Tax=Microbulbifer sp. ZKSA004 TaxID=3243389 RepID=UPI004039C18B
MKKIIFAVAACLVSIDAMSLGNNDYYKVEHVYSWKSGEVHVWLEKNGGEHLCADQTYPTRYLMSRESVVEFDQKFSLLLTAKTTGQGVKMEYTCDETNRPWIDSIRF